MSLLIRAAVLGGIAYLITRSMSGNSGGSQRRLTMSGGRTSPMNELHPSENNIWPTSESQRAATANVGPSS